LVGWLWRSDGLREMARGGNIAAAGLGPPSVGVLPLEEQDVGMRPKTTDELVRLLEDARSLRDLSTYFYGDGPDGRPLYTGARFDVLDGGGSRPAVRDKITPSDLLAVACLEVIVPTPVCLDLVEGPLGEPVTGFLSEIPAAVQMGDMNADQHVKDKSPADKAWQLLHQEVGVGWGDGREVAGEETTCPDTRLGQRREMCL
jgi:uncharacterized protein DUF6308